MLKGCQKRVIWVRNPESGWFDEVYFILSDNTDREISENNILKEANKIISSSPFAGYYGLAPIKNKRRKNASCSPQSKLTWFAIGSFITGICAIAASFLI